MDVAEHWHAFAWVGHERPADDIRVQPSQPTPPLEVSHWLKKPKQHVAKTFKNSSSGVAAASQWMRTGGEEQQYASEESFPLDARMVYVDDSLSRGADVVWGYYSKKLRYVSRALVACPREGKPCPYGH
ncbi:hypothetical protein [Streptomyces sp. NBC_01197]|uniref:hypothetical protein n=1 Tax=Streptomyces sp. NBC_01197 TaxID=2903768 RepID=UPI002E110B63|nr:hypothetical protein OG452_05445 [Streptomyces sp. NBC_01197]